MIKVAPITKSCEICGTEFTRPAWRAKKMRFCSGKCQGKHFQEVRKGSKVICNCEHCGKEISMPKSQFGYAKTHCCSKECMAEHKKTIIKGENNPHWKGGIKYVFYKCEVCGEIKKGTKENYINSEHHFCSRVCKSKWASIHQSGENNPNFKNGTINFKCDNCDIEGAAKRYQFNKNKFHFCSQKCHIEHRVKTKRYGLENNGQWQGGLSYEPYPLVWSYELRERIRERDNRTCQECNRTEHELSRRLSIHHIDYNKDNCDENNLISLCVNCHGKTTINRNSWMIYFQEKLKTRVAI